MNVAVIRLGFMQTLRLFLVLPIVLAGCSPVPSVNDLESLEKITSLSSLPEFVGQLPPTPQVRLFEGLPSKWGESDLLESERRKHRTILRGGFDFYDSPILMNDNDIVALSELIQSTNAFDEWTPYKDCFGFHPDFTTVWQCKDGDLEIQLCFGCSEARLFWQDRYLKCDLTDTLDARFKTLLRSYHKKLSHPDTGG